MREILFRGKCVDAYAAGEWAYGFYTNEEYNEVYETPCSEVKDHYIENQDDTIRVAPETIGQYTGLKDKNGKRIFEGDIVTIPDTKKQGLPAVVWYDKRMAQFTVRRIGYQPLTLWEAYEIYEVIGNVHDNPELLEEA